MKYNAILILILLCNAVSAQIFGVVKDSISKEPIPYVNIALENENLGTTSEENGQFKIAFEDQGKNLVFSALGYQKKKVRISQAAEVYLKPAVYELDEIVISKRYETRELEIGKTDSPSYQAFDHGPRIDTKFFPYLPEYKKTKFIKQVVISTDSKIEEAFFKIHFYSVDANGFPGEEMLKKDFIVSVSQGVKKTKFNLTRFNLRMPKEGIFVGFEKLIIEKNKLEKTITDPNTQQMQIQRKYYPLVLYAAIERDFTFAFSGGKWTKQTQPAQLDPSIKVKINEPVIGLILTN